MVKFGKIEIAKEKIYVEKKAIKFATLISII